MSQSDAAIPSSSSRQAFRALLDYVQRLDAEYLSPERGIAEAADVAEGEHMVLHLLKAAIDVYVDNDAGRPRFAPLAGPTLKFGGEGADNPAFCAPLDPKRRYRVRGRRDGEVYVSLTVYKGAADGDWNQGVVSALNHTEIEIGPDGRFEVEIGAEPAPGALYMDPDAVNCVISRHYYENAVCAVADPSIHPQIEIEVIDGEPSFPRPASPDDLAARLAAAVTFMDGQTLGRAPQSPENRPGWFSIVPNVLPKPERWEPSEGGGAGAVDNAYCAAPFVLGPEEALVIEGRWPTCVYANVMLWNRFMQGFDYRYRPTSLNRTQTRADADGRFRIVVAHRDPRVPNWLDTEGRPGGLIYWRFLLPEDDIEQPRCEVVPFASLGG